MQRIRIAGSGPAGMTAAINLARAGLPVTVFEKHPDSGQRFQGDLQGLENWSGNGDYGAAVQAFFANRLRASVVNRFIWERFGRDNYGWSMDRIDRAADHLGFLHSLHNFNLVQRLAYPLARRFVCQRLPGLWR